MFTSLRISVFKKYLLHAMLYAYLSMGRQYIYEMSLNRELEKCKMLTNILPTHVKISIYRAWHDRIILIPTGKFRTYVLEEDLYYAIKRHSFCYYKAQTL